LATESVSILVAGGTTESRQVTEALLFHGYHVIYSKATETVFPMIPHPQLEVRFGRLDATGWGALAKARNVKALIDASHPHAIELRATLRQVGVASKLPIFRLKRAYVDLALGTQVVGNHLDAAVEAVKFGQTCLLTIGTRSLAKYVEAFSSVKLPFFARVLDNVESRTVVDTLRLAPNQVIWGRGPFSVEQNLRHLRQCAASVLVTKDSGAEGGISEKLEAAKRCNCYVIVVARPKEDLDAVDSVKSLLIRLKLLGL
jgi:precorrin-6A/cobalt-precorrin-6A reductase